MAAIIAASYLFLPSVPAQKVERKVDYTYLDQNKKVLKRLDYKTFRSHLDSGEIVIRIPNQDSFVEDVIWAVNTQPELIPERGFTFRREVDKEKFAKFVFDDVLKEKLKYEIKTPTDLIVGLNMALEYLARYNHKMFLENQGLGSDINNDGKFDGLTWSSLAQIEDEDLVKSIIQNPEKGEKISRKECNRVDRSATDKLLMEGKGEPNAVRLVCRNYTSALEVLFETAKERYPDLTKDLELLQMLMPGHVFGAFVNKSTLEYIMVDPTWHDSGKEFSLENFAWDNDKSHEDCLKKEAFFESIIFDRLLYDYWKAYDDEFFSHGDSKKMIEKIVPKFQEFAKKYPDSPEVANLAVLIYGNLGNHKELYPEAFKLLKGIYDAKEYREKIDTHYQSVLLYFLGELAFELENYGEALKYFQEGSKFRVAANMFVDEAMIGLAKTQLKLGNHYEAMFRAKDVLELCPRHSFEAHKILYLAAFNLWSEEKSVCEGLESTFFEYLSGDYENVIKELKGNSLESKLFLAESYASLNKYDKARSIYDELLEGDNEKIAALAKSELEQMNYKLFLYAYTHFFDYKFEESVKEFEFIKGKITFQEEFAPKLSYLLVWAYEYTKQSDKALDEANYFLQTFPDSEYKPYVEQYLQYLEAKQTQEGNT